MSVLYPADFSLQRLSKTALALKVARHSRCSKCDSCPGLHPPPNVVVALDSSESKEDHSLGELAQYGSDDEDKDSSYLDLCACGHDTTHHRADELRLGKDEYARRARVAIRMDELLSVCPSYIHGLDGLPHL